MGMKRGVPECGIVSSAFTAERNLLGDDLGDGFSLHGGLLALRHKANLLAAHPADGRGLLLLEVVERCEILPLKALELWVWGGEDKKGERGKPDSTVRSEPEGAVRGRLF